MSSIDAFREIAQSAYPQTRVLPRSHNYRDRFGYNVDARHLVQEWDALTARAESAEAKIAELQSTISALLKAL